MTFRQTLCISLGVFLWFCALAVFATNALPAEPPAAPAVAIYQRFAVPTPDGKTLTAIFAPGPESGSMVLLLPDFTAYRLVPLGQPTPAPVPPTPPAPGPSPNPPTPPPPTPPTPLVGLAKVAAEAFAAAKLPKEEAPKVAAVFESIAARAAAGTLRTPEDIIAATKEARAKSLGPERLAAWNGWAATIGAALNAEASAGRLATMDAHAAAWRAIAEGLRR